MKRVNINIENFCKKLNLPNMEFVEQIPNKFYIQEGEYIVTNNPDDLKRGKTRFEGKKFYRTLSEKNPNYLIIYRYNNLGILQPIKIVVGKFGRIYRVCEDILLLMGYNPYN